MATRIPKRLRLHSPATTDGSPYRTMFTGIVVDTGVVTDTGRGGARQVRIEPGRMPDAVQPGSSIACAGVCLTATATDPSGFTADLSPETLARTTAGEWRAGTRVNLEYGLRAGDPLDGHIVTGHVDATAEVLEVAPGDAGSVLSIAVPDAVAGLLAPKGSVAVEGASLTVNAVDAEAFSVTLIPHTSRVTTLGALAAGAVVNLEADVLARYVARLLGRGGRPGGAA